MAFGHLHFGYFWKSRLTWHICGPTTGEETISHLPCWHLGFQGLKIALECPRNVGVQLDCTPTCSLTARPSSLITHWPFKMIAPYQVIRYAAYLHVALGGFLFRKVWNFKLCLFPSCSHCFTDFRTIFVFALGPFLPMVVIFFRLQWEFQWENGQNKKNG